jgi:hypothetical protein
LKRLLVLLIAVIWLCVSAPARLYGGFRLPRGRHHPRMSSEAEYLKALIDACHRVLPHIEGREDNLAETIRETCQTVEERLRELEAGSASP